MARINALVGKSRIETAVDLALTSIFFRIPIRCPPAIGFVCLRFLSSKGFLPLAQPAIRVERPFPPVRKMLLSASFGSGANAPTLPTGSMVLPKGPDGRVPLQIVLIKLSQGRLIGFRNF